MSLKSRTLVRGLVAAGVSTVAFAGAVAPAQANFTKTLTYSCTYPYVGAQPLSVDIDAAIPASLPGGVPSDEFAVTAVATAGGDTSSAVDLIGAETIEGVADAKATVKASGGDVPVDLSIGIPAQAVAPTGDLVLNAAGNTPSVTATGAGPAPITVDSLALNLTAKGGPTGGPIVLPPVGADSDGDPNTFDVACGLSPDTQDTTLGTVNIT